jgi:hypothetical protein
MISNYGKGNDKNHTNKAAPILTNAVFLSKPTNSLKALMIPGMRNFVEFERTRNDTTDAFIDPAPVLGIKINHVSDLLR